MIAIRSTGAMLLTCVAVSVSAEGLTLYGDNLLDAPLAAVVQVESPLVSTSFTNYGAPGDMSSVRFDDQPTSTMPFVASPAFGIGFRNTDWQSETTATTTVEPIQMHGIAKWQTIGVGPLSESLGTPFKAPSPTIHSTTFDVPLIGEHLIERGWQVDRVGGFAR